MSSVSNLVRHAEEEKVAAAMDDARYPVLSVAQIDVGLKPRSSRKYGGSAPSVHLVPKSALTTKSSRAGMSWPFWFNLAIDLFLGAPMRHDLPHDDDSPAVLAAPELRVSYHAVTRYVQRILKITVSGDFPDEKTRARHHCRAAGVSIRDVRKMIWTPGIALASSMRLPNASNGTFSVAIDPIKGVILTVMEPWARDLSRLKLLSERELSRKAKKKIRQEKRKPKAGTLKVIADQERLENA